MDFDKAILLDPKGSAKYYYMRGICYQMLGNTQRANADFAKAREMGYRG